MREILEPKVGSIYYVTAARYGHDEEIIGIVLANRIHPGRDFNTITMLTTKGIVTDLKQNEGDRKFFTGFEMENDTVVLLRDYYQLSLDKMEVDKEEKILSGKKGVIWKRQSEIVTKLMEDVVGHEIDLWNPSATEEVSDVQYAMQKMDEVASEMKSVYEKACKTRASRKITDSLSALFDTLWELKDERDAMKEQQEKEKELIIQSK